MNYYHDRTPFAGATTDRLSAEAIRWFQAKIEIALRQMNEAVAENKRLKKKIKELKKKSREDFVVIAELNDALQIAKEKLEALSVGPYGTHRCQDCMFKALPCIMCAEKTRKGSQ